MGRSEHRADVPKPWPFAIGFEFIKAKRFDAKARAECQALTQAGAAVRIEEKCDGWRVLIAYAPGDRVRCYSRGISATTGTYIDLLEKYGAIPAVTQLYLGPGDALEAELEWPGHRAAEVPTALKDQRGLLRVRAFAVPYEGGEPLTTYAAQAEYLKDMEVPTPTLFGFAPHMLTDEALTKYATQRGFEGWMMKVETDEGPRWWKYKLEGTADVVVLDTKDSKGYLKGTDGMVGSLVVGVLCTATTHDDHACWDLEGLSYREVAAVSGLEDEERDAMTAERGSLPGRVCEIRFQREGGKDRLRHPRFVRWREDKPRHECTGLDILELLEDA